MAITKPKQKVFVVTNGSASLDDLNKQLAADWKVLQVHQSAGGQASTYWLVVAEERVEAS